MAQGQLINLGNVMEQWSNTIVNVLRKEVKDDDTKASGRLLASIAPKIQIFGSKFTIEILMEDYWKAVDQGTKPGTLPDVQKILRWMQHKKILPAPAKVNLTSPRSARARKVFKDRRLALAERIAFAIKRKGTIKRFDYGGSGFVSDYAKTLELKMVESIRGATGRDITIQIKAAFK